jgi:hypothetical protein
MGRPAERVFAAARFGLVGLVYHPLTVSCRSDSAQAVAVAMSGVTSSSRGSRSPSRGSASVPGWRLPWCRATPRTEFDGPNAAYATSRSRLPREPRGGAGGVARAARRAGRFGARVDTVPVLPSPVPEPQRPNLRQPSPDRPRARRCGCHVACEGVPDARPSRRPARPAGSEPIGDPALEPQRLRPADARVRQHSGGCSGPRAGRDPPARAAARGRTAARSHTRSSTFPVTSGCGSGGDRVRPVSAAAPR